MLAPRQTRVAHSGRLGVKQRVCKRSTSSQKLGGGRCSGFPPANNAFEGIGGRGVNDLTWSAAIHFFHYSGALNGIVSLGVCVRRGRGGGGLQ